MSAQVLICTAVAYRQGQHLLVQVRHEALAPPLELRHTLHTGTYLGQRQRLFPHSMRAITMHTCSSSKAGCRSCASLMASPLMHSSSCCSPCNTMW